MPLDQSLCIEELISADKGATFDDADTVPPDREHWQLPIRHIANSMHVLELL
jgi:hypothetical protein